MSKVLNSIGKKDVLMNRKREKNPIFISKNQTHVISEIHIIFQFDIINFILTSITGFFAREFERRVSIINISY